MPEPFHALLPNLPQHPPDSVQTLIQILKRRTEREPDEVMARRVEQVPTVGRVDVEEDSGDHDRSLFQELFEESETVVQGWWEVIQVQPDVERAEGWDVHFQPQLLKSCEDVISLRLEVSLQGEPLLGDMLGGQQREGSKLKRVISPSVEVRT